MNDTTLNKTLNWFSSVGTLYEKNLKREDVDIKITDDKGNETGKKKGERIRGNVTVRTDDGIHDFNVYFSSLTSKGEEARQWTMAQAMMDWVPEIGIGGDRNNPTKVRVQGSISINDYVTPSKTMSSRLRWRVAQGNTRTGDDTKSSTFLKVVLYINAIAHEMANEEETGRLKVTGYGAQNDGTCFPVEFFVDKDIAEDFENFYSIGDTVEFRLSLFTRHAGGNRRKVGLSSKREVKQDMDGFDVTELTFVTGSDVIEEPDEQFITDDEGNEVPVKTDWINPKAMKAAIKVREEKLKELLEKGPAKKNNAPAAKPSVAERMNRRAAISRTADDFPDLDDDNMFDEDFDNL